MRETVDNKVYFEQADYDKLVAEVPKVCSAERGLPSR